MTKDDLNVMQLSDILTLALSTDDLIAQILKERAMKNDALNELKDLQNQYQKCINENINLNMLLKKQEKQICDLVEEIAIYEDRNENLKKDT